MPSLKPSSDHLIARGTVPWGMKTEAWVVGKELATRPLAPGFDRVAVEAALLLFKDWTARLELTLQPKPETKDAA